MNHYVVPAHARPHGATAADHARITWPGRRGTSRASRAITLAVALCLGGMGLVSTAQAGSISAQAVAQAAVAGRSTTPPAGSPQAGLTAALEREDLRLALIERGVDLDQARLRVAALGDAEAARLLADIDQAPAGAGIVDTLVFLFLVLLVTDILGFTKVFPFTRSIR
ncbi:MAG: hypothetical protein RLZZ584_3764 [Pseudomonadota bacterium]